MLELPADAYLDIETTGLFAPWDYITVVGIYIDGNSGGRLVQLVGEEVTPESLLEAMEGVGTVFTYNGSRFDLPFIRDSLGVDLGARHGHEDLMYQCWRHDLYGGLKRVEMQLGIARQLKGVGGLEAVRLWWQYRNWNDLAALNTLLAYNREDLLNLKTLRAVLASFSGR